MSVTWTVTIMNMETITPALLWIASRGDSKHACMHAIIFTDSMTSVQEQEQEQQQQQNPKWNRPVTMFGHHLQGLVWIHALNTLNGKETIAQMDWRAKQVAQVSCIQTTGVIVKELGTLPGGTEERTSYRRSTRGEA